MNANGASYESTEKIHWVICGGESGRNARPMHPDWARSLRDQTKRTGAAFFFKQWGEWAPAYEIATTVSVEVAQVDGVKNPQWTEHEETKFQRRQLMARVGKKSAGARIDTCEWKEFPEQ